MILKHRDTEVLRFDWVEPFGVKNVEVNSAAERFLPLSFREQVRMEPESLRYWLEESQYFLQNRIAKIIRYREKADRYLSIRRKNDTVNPMISDKLLKKAKEAENLRKEPKATLKSFPRAKTEKLAILFKTTTRTIARHVKALKDAGELIRIGSDKTGYWQVIEKGGEA